MHELKQICANLSHGSGYIPFPLREMAHTEDVESSVPQPQMPALPMNLWESIVAPSASEIDPGFSALVNLHHPALHFLIITYISKSYLTNAETTLERLIRKRYDSLTYHAYPHDTGEYYRNNLLFLDDHVAIGEAIHDYRCLYYCENRNRHSIIWTPRDSQYEFLVDRKPLPISETAVSISETAGSTPVGTDSEHLSQAEGAESSQNLSLAANPMISKLEGGVERAEFYRSRLARTIHLLGTGGIDGVEHQRIMRGHKADE